MLEGQGCFRLDGDLRLAIEQLVKLALPLRLKLAQLEHQVYAKSVSAEELSAI
jgi:hypothetical protein